jgi:N-acetylneuraminic acid mutarotase
MPETKSLALSCVIGEEIFVTGGLIEVDGQAYYSDSLFVFNALTGTWDNSRTPIPEPIGNAGVAAVDGKIYVAGGSNSFEQALKSLLMYDPSADNWTPKAARRNQACVAFDGKIYCIGGLGNGVMNILTINQICPNLCTVD